MELNLTQEVRKETLLDHMIIECMSEAIFEQVVKNKNKDGDIICNVKLIVNEYELDIRKFINHWQKQVDEIIKDKAIEITKDKFSDLNSLFFDLEERLSEEIDKRMEDWEKEK